MTDALSTIREALGGGQVRIEFSFAFGTSGTHPSAQVYRKDGAKWVKAGPFVIPPDGGTRADLLDMFAALLRETEAATS